MTSLDAQCRSTFAIVTQSVLDDAHWRAFGYRRRPRRGKIFLRFANELRLDRETALLHELWATSFGTMFCWVIQADRFKHRVTFIAKLMEYCVDGLGEPLWSPLRFLSRREAIDYLVRACCDYANANEDDRANMFLERCLRSMSGDLPKEWLAGVAFLFAHPNSFLVASTFGMNQAQVAENPDCDIEVEDTEFLTIAKDLAGELGGSIA